MKKSEIVYFTREQLIDFLLENWIELVRQLPDKKERAYFERQPLPWLLFLAVSFGD